MAYLYGYIVHNNTDSKTGGAPRWFAPPVLGCAYLQQPTSLIRPALVFRYLPNRNVVLSSRLELRYCCDHPAMSIATQHLTLEEYLNL